jgi:3-deoxy-7-phosphoheptulonate synthase
VDGVSLGGKAIRVMAGPCSVESREQLLETAHAVRQVGATFLRGGAFKPRTSPYEFQGLGEEGLKLLALAREQTGLKVVTEVMDAEQLPMVAEYADVLQIGARNMQNFSLLRRLGTVGKPVLLKRGPSATIREWLMAAEYVVSEGNYRVALCERGIRTFETMTRNTLDLNAVPVLKALTHLPVVVDPSHGIGLRAHVPAMARAGIAAGADGLIVEVHPAPDRALSDGAQSLTPTDFAALMEQVKVIAGAIGRPV